ncbi:hypothetical protein KI387_000852, partial [Taxus chinensis]
PDLIDGSIIEGYHTVQEASSTEQGIEEPLVLPPTSSPSNSNVEEDLELSKFMFEDERNHGEKVLDQGDPMEEVEHMQQDSKE